MATEYTQEEIESLGAEHPFYPPKDARVTGPIHGGELAIDRFGIMTHLGNEATIARFYNGNRIETKRLIEILNGKIWVRDERY